MTRMDLLRILRLGKNLEVVLRGLGISRWRRHGTKNKPMERRIHQLIRTPTSDRIQDVTPPPVSDPNANVNNVNNDNTNPIQDVIQYPNITSKPRGPENGTNYKSLETIYKTQPQIQNSALVAAPKKNRSSKD